MPRGARKHANQHSSRHQNGVVDPGKRVVKQKSNGHLNGSATPRGSGAVGSRVPSDSPIAPPLPASPTLQTGSAGAHTNGTILRRTSSQASKSESRVTPTESTPSDVERSEQSEATGKSFELRRKMDLDISSAGEHHAAKHGHASPSPHPLMESNPLHLTLTVLTSCPLRDTLAILIFLLSLPPTMLSITNSVFAVLTFVPPSGSFTSFPTLADIMSAPSPGAPSFIVMFFIDIAAWLLLGFFAPWVQLLLLDYAQAMVATTLGGRSSPSAGGAAADSTMQCVGMVSALHVTRHRAFILRMLHRTWLWRWLPEIRSFDYFDFPPSYVVGRSRGPLEGLNVFIALHIVCQGFTRVVRRWLHDSQKSMQLSGFGTDPEAVAGCPAGSEVQDSGHHPPSTPVTTRSNLQSMREGKDKISSGKRRKKQGNFVRSQQPLWAAFAATKATIMREYEQSLATTEALGSNASDGKHLGNATFPDQEARVWITDVLSLNFFFETGPFHRANRGKGRRKSSEDDEAAERSKPLFVRINSADWASVKIKEFPEGQDEKGRPRWTGEVYGLSPSNTYHASFHGSEDGALIHSEAISTPSLPVIEQGIGQSIPLPDLHLPQAAHSPASIAPQPQPPTPTSPTATLKASISAFENSINDVTTNQRRVKKDSKATVMLLRREIDQLKEKLARHDNNDKGLQSRQIQQSQHIRQADEAIATLTEELDSLASSPPDEGSGSSKGWGRRKTSWERSRRDQAQARDELMQAKEANKRQETAAQADALSARQKRERLQQRVAKLSRQHAILTTPPSSSSSTPEYRSGSATEHAAARQAERTRLEAQYQEKNELLVRKITELNYLTNISRHEYQQLKHAAIQAQQQQQQHHSPQSISRMLPSQPPSSRLQYESGRPLTPEGDLPGTNPLAAAHYHQQQQPYAFPTHPPGLRRPSALAPHDLQSSGPSSFGPIGAPALSHTPSTSSSAGAPHDASSGFHQALGDRLRGGRARSTSGGGSMALDLAEDEEEYWSGKRTGASGSSGSGSGRASASPGLKTRG